MSIPIENSLANSVSMLKTPVAKVNKICSTVLPGKHRFYLSCFFHGSCIRIQNGCRYWLVIILYRESTQINLKWPSLLATFTTRAVSQIKTNSPYSLQVLWWFQISWFLTSAISTCMLLNAQDSLAWRRTPHACGKRITFCIWPVTANARTVPPSPPFAKHACTASIVALHHVSTACSALAGPPLLDSHP